MDYVEKNTAEVPYCYQQAAARQNIPLRILLAVRKTEGGTVGMKKRNKNNTFDYGVFQINTVWLEKLAEYGITESMLQNNHCISAYSAAYILRYHINQAGGDLWMGVGRYHSKTLRFKYPYIKKVYKNAREF